MMVTGDTYCECEDDPDEPCDNCLLEARLFRDTAPCSLCGEDVRTVPEGGALCETCASKLAAEQ